ncbi:heme-binding protein [Methylobacterium sp. C25]|nr:heme-binding protein [Methylobacterium sp. C25]
MRLPPLVAVSCALSLAILPAAAQQPPPAAPNLPDKVPFGAPYGAPIGLEQARKIVAASLAEGEKRGWPVNIAVVDTHGELVHFARMDGAQLASIDISQRKARTAARWRRESKVFFEAYSKGPPIYGTLDPGLAASAGGIPLIVEGKLIGAVGCSGGTSDQDVVVCQAGVDALK